MSRLRVFGETDPWSHSHTIYCNTPDISVFQVDVQAYYRRTVW